MASRNTVSWIIASFPLLCVGYMFLEISEAAFHFGHLPQYMVDPDPFHKSWESIFSDAGFLIYFLLPLFLLLALPLLVLPKFRYLGKHRLIFCLLVAVSVIATWLFTIRDVTGFIGWRLD
jgi:hypothetical protein